MVDDEFNAIKAYEGEHPWIDRQLYFGRALDGHVHDVVPPGHSGPYGICSICGYEPWYPTDPVTGQLVRTPQMAEEIKQRLGHLRRAGAEVRPERADREGDTQALPIKNAEVDTQAVALAMIARRKELGIRRYGTALQPNNGRDSLWDAVEEALDLFTYLLNYWREQHPGEDTPS